MKPDNSKAKDVAAGCVIGRLGIELQSWEEIPLYPELKKNWDKIKTRKAG